MHFDERDSQEADARRKAGETMKRLRCAIAALHRVQEWGSAGAILLRHVLSGNGGAEAEQTARIVAGYSSRMEPDEQVFRTFGKRARDSYYVQMFFIFDVADRRVIARAPFLDERERAALEWLALKNPTGTASAAVALALMSDDERARVVADSGTDGPAARLFAWLD